MIITILNLKGKAKQITGKLKNKAVKPNEVTDTTNTSLGLVKQVPSDTNTTNTTLVKQVPLHKTKKRGQKLCPVAPPVLVEVILHHHTQYGKSQRHNFNKE